MEIIANTATLLTPAVRTSMPTSNQWLEEKPAMRKFFKCWQQRAVTSWKVRQKGQEFSLKPAYASFLN